MRKHLHRAVVIIVLAVGSAGGAMANSSDSLDARSLLNRFDDLFRGKSSHGKMAMTVKTAHWSRTLEMEFWSKGTEKSLIRILSPKKERGTATLKSGSDLWNYLPKVNRVIKLPASMLASSWMGSHFSNDDLVKESRFSEDYEFSITGRTKTDSATVIEVTCIPNKDAVVVWGKVVVRFDSVSALPLSAVYYDEDLRPARTMTFSDVRKMGGRTLPLKLDLTPADKPEERTTVTYEYIEYDLDLPDKMFTLRNLKR